MRHSGFSLIELMVVIAIVALLAAIAVPVYSSYTTRAAKMHAMAFAEALVTKMAIGLNDTGSFSSNLADYGVTRVDMEDGGIDAVAPYVMFLTQDASGTPSTSCAAREFYIGIGPFGGDGLYPEIFGGTGTSGEFGYIGYVVYEDENGVINTFCSVNAYFDGETPMTIDYNTVPGCVPAGSAEHLAFFAALDACPD